MSRLPMGRLALIAFVLAVSAFLLFTKPIRYGLDLQGGAHLLLRVHADEAIENEVDDAYASISSALRENDIAIQEDSISLELNEESTFVELADHSGNPPVVTFTLQNASDVSRARELIAEKINLGGDWNLNVSGSTLRLVLNPAAIEAIRAQTVDNVRRAIEHRINSLGVSEPNIVTQGDPAVEQRILLQLPGVEDPEEAKRRIQTPGNLEFRLVVYNEAGQPIEGLTQDDILDQVGGELPTGTEMVPEYAQTRAEAAAQGIEQRTPIRWVLLYNEAPVNSQYLMDARRSTDQSGRIAVAFTLNAEGGERMRRMTRPNVGKLMANVLDGEAIVVARLEGEIGSDGQITGNYTIADADRLVYLLRTGAIPTSMHVEEERSVTPALGIDSIRMSFQAFMYGMIGVALFMILYYRLSGVLAVFVLSLNIVLILAFLVMFEAVLTLPGIAGIILTIGMAVDANVIIFERIREERAIGRSVIGAVDSGFGKAFGTIFDANITTLIAAVFLFQFGTGPIRGFATTITIGILSSMFTAIFVARTVYDSIFALKRNKVQKLSI